MIESVFHSYKVPFNILSEFTHSVASDTINIWIDGWSLIEPFFRDDRLEYMRTASGEIRTLFVPELFNIAAHYRKWYQGRLRAPVHTRFFFLFQTEPSNLQLENPEYRDKQLTRFIRPEDPVYIETSRTMHNCIEAATILSKSIPGVYVLDTRNLESSVVVQILSQNQDYHANKNVILTRTIRERQQFNYVPNCVIADPNSQKSRCWTQDIAHEAVYSMLPSSKREKIRARNRKIQSDAIPVILSLMGKREYGIASIPSLGIIRSFDLANQLYDEHVLENTWYEYNILVERTHTCEEFTGTIRFENFNTFAQNLKCALIRYQTAQTTFNQINRVVLQIEDAPDPVRVASVSAQYHPNNPIYTQDLWKAL